MRIIQNIAHASKRGAFRLTVAALSVLLATGTFWFAQQHAAAVRFIDRSLYIQSSIADDRTTYTFTFTYPTVNAVGSVRLLFCTEAIPYLPCDIPAGLDVSSALLAGQSGEVGFTIHSRTQNSIIISRPPVATAITESTYTFTNVKNPSATQKDFSVRLNSYASTDATGSFIDFGSVVSSTAHITSIDTQVPPILVFCTGKEIPEDCTDPKGPNFEDFEEATTDEVMTTSSEMLAYTNARGGYVVVMSGRSLTSGIHEIPAIENQAEESIPGKGQFGVNLTANDNPDVGADPVGPATNVALNPAYLESDKFLFNDGDVLVTSNGVTKPKKFTVSYIVNVPPDQHPGVYNTTVTFICTGNF